MPEGDTVYRTAVHLDRALAGRVLTRSDFRVPSLAEVNLSGETVESVRSVGKHILHRIGGFTLRSHLRMEGAWHVLRQGAAWPRPAHSARVVLSVTGIDTVGFDLTNLDLVPRLLEDTLVADLGPDLLKPSWAPVDAALAVQRLTRAPEREIAAALLDQRVMAGLGNVYVTELCFLRGVHPTAPVSDAGPPETLVALARKLILANRDRTERTTTGDLRAGRRTYVYGRQGQPCRRCGTRIVRGEHGRGARRPDDPSGPSDERVSTCCPRCQPPPAERSP